MLLDGVIAERVRVCVDHPYRPSQSLTSYTIRDGTWSNHREYLVCRVRARVNQVQCARVCVARTFQFPL